LYWRCLERYAYAVDVIDRQEVEAIASVGFAGIEVVN